MSFGPRLLIVLGGLFGAAGIALAAAASHGGSERLLETASTMMLAHAPALLATAHLAVRQRLMTGAGLVLAGGVILFSGDLIMRAWLATGAFAMAAPIGGMAMIVGWLAVAIVAFLPLRHDAEA